MLKEAFPLGPKEEGSLQNLFYENSITVMLTTEKDTIRKESYRIVSVMNLDAKIFN